MSSIMRWSRAISMTTMSPRIITISIICFSLAANAEKVPCGDFWCHNGAVCQQGLGDPQGGLENPHCNCTEGWTGIGCFVKVDECDGGHKCYYGGQCIAGLTYCNCDNAVDASGNNYVGKYCEHQVDSVCDEEVKSFCVNGGKCNPHYLSTGNPCICPSSYGGEHCEYTSETVPQCKDDCKNGGVCKLSVLPSLTEEISWCQCPPGFLGNSCETPVAPCGQRYCFNGGVCRSENECRCGHEWTGPSCEVMKIPDTTTNHHAHAPVVEPVPETSQATPPISPSAPVATFLANSNQTIPVRKSEVFIAKIFLFAFLATSACVCGIWGRRTRRKRIISSSMGFSRGMLYIGSDYRDISAEKNIAPKMDDDDDEFFAKFISPVAPASDRSPRSARAAIDADRAPTFEYSPRASNRVASKSDTNDAAPPPQLYMGPPRDEDGNELYSVEIL